jgi:nitroimidazol reductase NimA-like FMN-containing flavoprotein (pyridoxamine 5'-phosphate oxidase superfamily)
MPDWTGTRMDGVEIADFLEAHSTGVLSLARENEGYGFPVSYAYEDDEPAVYVRLGFTPESQKRAFVDAVERASLVVYEETADGWQSVVVEGSLRGVGSGQPESALAEAVRGFTIPFFAVFPKSAGDLDFSLYRLAADSLTGVAEAT